MTADASQKLTEKIAEVCAELQRLAHWKREAPDWVYQYKQASELALAFDEWLQFVYLPNLLQTVQSHKTVEREQNLAPQAVAFFGDEVKRGKMLQLLVELDSLL